MSASHILHCSRPHAYVLKVLRACIPSLCLHARVKLRACAATQGLTWGAEGDERLKLLVARWTIAMVYALQAHLRQGYNLQAALQVRAPYPTLPLPSPLGWHHPYLKFAAGSPSLQPATGMRLWCRLRSVSGQHCREMHAASLLLQRPPAPLRGMARVKLQHVACKWWGARSRDGDV